MTSSRVTYENKRWFYCSYHLGICKGLRVLCQGQVKDQITKQVTPNILITWEFIRILGGLCQEPGGSDQNMYFFFLP